MKIQRKIALGCALSLIAMISIACGKGGGNATPTQTFQTFYNSVKAKDVQGLKSIVMKRDLDEMEAEAKKNNKSIDDFLKDEVIGQLGRKIPAQMPEIRNEKIEGDTATIEVKDGENWRPARFAKEDGGWKMNM